MKELGMTLSGCGVIIGFFALLIYPNLEVKNQPSNRSCILLTLLALVVVFTFSTSSTFVLISFIKLVIIFFISN